MPTHPHNKAPTADRLVAGGGFSLDDAQRQNAFAQQDTLYIGIAERSARPFVRQRPECAAFVDARQLVGQVHAKSPHVLAKSPAFLSPPRRRARPHGRGTGEKFHIAVEKVRRNAHAFTFFLFLLAFYAGKTRYICIENLFYQLRMAKARPFVPVFR